MSFFPKEVSFFPKATVKGHGVTVNVEVRADAAIADPPKPETPKLELIPFDIDAYDKDEVAKQAATYAKYNAKRGCVKCGAPGSGFPHKSVYRTVYTVWPHATEYKNADLKWTHAKATDPNWWMRTSYGDSPRHRVHDGPGYIARQCVRCNYEWNELACDEPKEKSCHT